MSRHARLLSITNFRGGEIDMATKTTDRATFWDRHRKNFHASGLSRRAYCREHGLKVHQLAYQLGRAGKQRAATGKAAFARVVATDPGAVGAKGAARLCFGDGVALELDCGADPAWIAQVIAAVGGGR
jgi:hypothetical protein